MPSDRQGGLKTLNRKKAQALEKIAWDDNGMENNGLQEDGQIRLPGLASGVSMDHYLSLVHVHSSILEASRILDRHRPALTQIELADNQEPMTPLQASTKTPNLYFKREDLTITRAYKVRGAVVSMAKAMESFDRSKFLTVSTGNHALGIIQAARLLKPATVTIAVPSNTAPGKRRKIEEKIADLKKYDVEGKVVTVGETFDDCRTWAIAQQAEGEYYIDPYSNPWVVAGQGTIGLELLAQLATEMQKKPIEEIVLISPIGGGGLLAGTTTGLQIGMAWDPRFRNTSLKVVGLRLEDMHAEWGDAIRVKEIAPGNRHIFNALGIEIAEMDDATMLRCMKEAKDELDTWVEGPSAGTLSLKEREDVSPNEKRLTVCLISGGNVPYDKISEHYPL
ncbi:MAG: pyridoxal-phosphate dependent enzyme [Vampirovibrio sp.]|nr:pyridoxal-phosphate dependent enzyme [Vampirovibrio sp.]